MKFRSLSGSEAIVENEVSNQKYRRNLAHLKMIVMDTDNAYKTDESTSDDIVLSPPSSPFRGFTENEIANNLRALQKL